MNELKLEFNLKPISWNNCMLPVFAQRRIIRTKEYHQYRKAVHKIIESEYQDHVTNFCAKFSRSMCLTAKYIFEVPKSAMLTKKGELKLRSQDLGNFEKPLTDTIFKHINDMGYDLLDDSQILDLHLIKKVNEDYKITVILTKQLMNQEILCRLEKTA